MLKFCKNVCLNFMDKNKEVVFILIVICWINKISLNIIIVFNIIKLVILLSLYVYSKISIYYFFSKNVILLLYIGNCSI